jgi:hypothetical protein
MVSFYHNPVAIGHRPTRHTPQEPPYPMVTFPSSTITGTSLRPPVRASISFIAEGSRSTFLYATAAPAFS